jgi:hypothetical protein
MRKLFKALAILTLAAFVTTAFAGITLAAVVVKDGFMTVSVDDRGPDGARFTVPVPASLVNLALALVPQFVPAEEMAQIRREIGPYAPALHAAAKALEDCPQAQIVHVRTDNETVLISKGRRDFNIAVHSQDTDVRVSIPADSLRRVLNALGV